LVFSGNWWHEKSSGFDTENWIRHTVPGIPWKDKHAYTPQGSRWRGWDNQHWGMGHICQAYQITEDCGLELLIEHTAQMWLFMNPVVSKGTTHHKPGAARARGRVVEAGANMYHSLNNTDLKERVKQRIIRLLELQVEDWDARIAKHGHPYIARSDGSVAIWEHALWIKGIVASLGCLDSTSTLYDRLLDISLEMSEWILDGFQQWPDLGNRWYIPYTIKMNEGTSGNPSKGLSKWCLPSLQVLDRYGQEILTPEQITKLQNILDQFLDVAGTLDRWDSTSRWRLY
jgi:hypothetical protein